jgi:hypothetical protein
MVQDEFLINLLRVSVMDILSGCGILEVEQIFVNPDPKKWIVLNLILGTVWLGS